MKKQTLIFLTLFLSQIIFAQKQNGTWDYPIRPGTEKWQELDSYEKRLNAYNIPDSILSIMSTIDLVKTCLNYPEFRLIMTRNSLQLGYDYLKSIFNGFAELEKRSDSGKELIKLYEAMEPQKITQYDTPSKRGAFSFQFTCIELIMAQPGIQKNLSKKDIIQYFDVCTKKYDGKKLLENEYSMFDLGTTALTMGRLLNQEKHSDFEQVKQSNTQVRNFLEKSYPTTIEDFNLIYNYSKDYLKTYKNE